MQNNGSRCFEAAAFLHKKMQRLRYEPLQLFLFLFLSDPASHRYTVGLSADISTASDCLTTFACVLTVYHILRAIHEESLNS